MMRKLTDNERRAVKDAIRDGFIWIGVLTLITLALRATGVL